MNAAPIVKRPLGLIAACCAMVLAAAGCGTTPQARPAAQPGIGATVEQPGGAATAEQPGAVSTSSSGIEGPIYGGDPIHITLSSVELISTRTAAGIYAGLCPIEATFRATISVDRGPTDIGFQWERSTGFEYGAPTLHFGGTGAQSQTVTTTWPFGEASTGWLRLNVMSPSTVASEQGNFTAQCSGAVISDLDTSPRSHCGSPFTFHSSGSIYTNLPAGTMLYYRWRRSDGAQTPEQSVAVGLSPWSIGVQTSWQVGASDFLGSETLLVRWHDGSGDHLTEGPAPQFHLTCG